MYECLGVLAIMVDHWSALGTEERVSFIAKPVEALWSLVYQAVSRLPVPPILHPDANGCSR